METLADGIMCQQVRCRELLVQYHEIGPAGQFAYAAIEGVLKRTDKAVMEGDTVAMIGLYEELKGCE